jgi:hypothetical protein
MNLTHRDNMINHRLTNFKMGSHDRPTSQGEGATVRTPDKRIAIGSGNSHQNSNVFLGGNKNVFR